MKKIFAKPIKLIENFNAGRFLFLLFFSACLFAESSFAQQWQVIGPDALAINADANDGSSIVVSSYNKGLLFVSHDSGVTWINAGLQINNDIPIQLISDSSYLFCRTSNYIYESKDGGGTWQNISFNISANNVRLQLFNHRLFAIGGDTLYYKDPNSNIWKSTLSGFGNWEVSGVQLLSRKDSLYFTITMQFGYPISEKIYSSIDNGTSWQLFATYSNYVFFPPIPAFATYGDSLFYFSLTKKHYLGQYDFNQLTYSYAKDTYLYVSYDSGGSKQGMIRYDTSGHIKGIDQPLTEDGPVVYFFTLGNKLFEYKGFQLYTSMDDSNSWTNVHTKGLYGISSRFFIAANNTYFAGTYAGIFTSKDYGATWSFLLNDSLPNFMQGYAPNYNYYFNIKGDYPVDLVQANDTLFAASYYSGIFYSADNGITWHNAGFNDSSSTVINCLYHGHSNYYNNNKEYKSPLFAGVQSYGYGSTAGLYIRGVNRGTWSKFTSPDWLGNYIYITSSYFSRYPGFSDYDYIVNQRLSAPSGQPTIPYNGISYFVDSVSSFYICAQQGIFKYLSSPYNESLPFYTVQDVSNNLPNSDLYPSRWVNDGLMRQSRIFIATEGGAFVADTNDFNWSDISYNLQDRYVARLEYANGQIYAITGEGVFGINEVVTSYNDPSEPDISFLIYPNPSKRQCLLSLHYPPSAIHYSLKVEDLLGRSILQTGLLNGVNEIHFSGEISSGFYLFTLFADGKPVAEQKWLFEK